MRVGIPREVAMRKLAPRELDDLHIEHLPRVMVVRRRNSGTDEGQIAKFYLGTYYVDHGNNTEAEKYFKEAADGGDKAFASQAKFSLADLYAANGRRADAEKLLRELMNNPTVMVSKEQAQIELARVLATSNPGDARKLLEPLRTQGGGVGRIALSALAEIPAAR